MSELTSKLRDLGIGVGWTHPFFLPALSRITITEDPTDATPTMSVAMDGRVRVNPKWACKLPDAQLAGVLFHEIMHLMMEHAHRMEWRTMVVTDGEGGRPILLWNIAADMAINHVLKEMGIQLPPTACYPPSGHEGENAEQLYELLAKDVKPGGKGPKGATGGASSGCGTLPGEGDGKGEGKDGEGADASGAGTNHAEEWEKVAVQAKSLAAGTGKGDILAKLFQRKESIRWESICRSAVSHAVAQHGRDSQTFTRRSRRSSGRVIYPGWKATKAIVVVVIDASGSVSDEQLSRAVDQIQKIATIADARVYLVVHDAGVQTKGWLDGRNRGAIGARIIGRGGTTFDEAYAAVEEVPRNFDVMVHLTDGEVYHWPDRPKNVRRLVVALLGECHPTPAPEGSITVNVKL